MPRSPRGTCSCSRGRLAQATSAGITARRYRTIQIRAGNHTITAAAPVPAELQTALDAIHGTH